MLHGSAESNDVDSHRYRANIQRVAHVKEVIQIESPSKNVMVGSDSTAITFTNEDMVGVQTPQNDALVVTDRSRIVQFIFASVWL